MARNKEWEKEMMKWSKLKLINLLEDVIRDGKEKQTSASGLNIDSVVQRSEPVKTKPKCKLTACGEPFRDDCDGCFWFQ